MQAMQLSCYYNNLFVHFLLVIPSKTRLMVKNNKTMVTFTVFFSVWNSHFKIMNPHNIECHMRAKDLLCASNIGHVNSPLWQTESSLVWKFCRLCFATLLIILLMWPHLNLMFFCIVQHHLILTDLFISRNFMPPHANQPTQPPIHHNLHLLIMWEKKIKMWAKLHTV